MPQTHYKTRWFQHDLKNNCSSMHSVSCQFLPLFSRFLPHKTRLKPLKSRFSTRSRKTEKCRSIKIKGCLRMQFGVADHRKLSETPFDSGRLSPPKRGATVGLPNCAVTNTSHDIIKGSARMQSRPSAASWRSQFPCSIQNKINPILAISTPPPRCTWITTCLRSGPCHQSHQK
ncbi:hypothetical protein Pan153_09570 [Gimesia panareensis]|uniref:Uncharacterized protein n=1 Tax=Gimesia panareensis TaxID=2527978 RepID=A0A518FJ79_9PLAN|nr:hypothetical protein Pan153_09570 [Gimesia panareensis]